MRSFAFFIFLTIAFVSSNAQYYPVSFTANGASTSIDSIQVENLFQKTRLTLNSTDVLHLVNTLSINNLSKNEEAIILYPNPMQETSKLEFYSEGSENIKFEIIDIMGKSIVKQIFEAKRGINCFEISGLISGSYIVNIISSKKKYSKNFISINNQSKRPSIKFLSQNLTNFSSDANNKSTKNIIQMQYNNGDRMLFKGFSGNYSRVITISNLQNTQNQTINFNFISCVDGDGNHYSVTTIENQTWMAENLKTTKYNNGVSIPLVTDNLQWASLTSPAYCWYENNYATYGKIYGALYNWFTIDSISTGGKNACPIGWHAASYDEWNTLINSIGGHLTAGGYLKETDTIHWLSPNFNATNFYGFTALPNGFRSEGNGSFGDIRFNGHFWTSTEQATTPAYNIGMSCINAEVSSGSNYKVNGKSVRCIKNQ